MNILVIFPHGNALNHREGAETRVWNLISWLVENNFNVSILHALKSKGEEDLKLKAKCQNVYYYRELYLFGVSDWYLSDFNPFFIYRLHRILKANKFDLIQIEFPFGFFVTKFLNCRKTPIIYDSLGVEAEFIKVSMLNPLFPTIFKPLAPKMIKFYEKLVCKFAHVILSVSDIDVKYIIKNYDISKRKIFLIQIPSSIKDFDQVNRETLREFSRNKLGLPKNKNLAIFHGGSTHPANKEAFDLLEKLIAPRIKNNQLMLVFAGQHLRRYKKQNIISLGFVEDLKDLLYAADFAIIPIKRGSGMRVKCADYISCALPFISTKKGLEGIKFLKNGEDCLIYKNVDKNFLKGIDMLASNKELREKFQNNLMEKSDNLSYKKIEKIYIQLIKGLIES